MVSSNIDYFSCKDINIIEAEKDLANSFDQANLWRLYVSQGRRFSIQIIWILI